MKEEFFGGITSSVCWQLRSVLPHPKLRSIFGRWGSFRAAKKKK